jgi:hypothetical protein
VQRIGGEDFVVATVTGQSFVLNQIRRMVGLVRACVRVCVRACARVCVRVCACVRARGAVYMCVVVRRGRVKTCVGCCTARGVRRAPQSGVLRVVALSRFLLLLLSRSSHRALRSLARLGCERSTLTTPMFSVVHLFLQWLLLLLLLGCVGCARVAAARGHRRSAVADAGQCAAHSR